MDCSPPNASAHGIFQVGILERVAISFSRDLPDPGIEPISLAYSTLAGEFFSATPAGLIPGSGRSLEKEMATRLSILAWKIPWTVHGVANEWDMT